jgi:DNA-binding SARP family transcriptional activator
MAGFRAFLFGKFRVERDGQNIDAVTTGKLQELFCYLLVFRNHPQPREVLSELLWENQTPDKSKKYLRQTLWKLQSALNHGQLLPEGADLLVEPGWIQINPGCDFWLDIAEFEQVYERYSGKKTRELSQSDFLAIRNVVTLYAGDLLEGWYQDWCIYEREHFRRMYLMLLDKLAKYCEAHQDYQAGLAYGAAILRQDRAFERAHRQIMRLYFLSGDRAQALRQYELCAAALTEELSVAPSKLTTQLYERIRADGLGPHPDRGNLPADSDALPRLLKDTLGRLDLLSNELDAFHLQIHREITMIKEIIHLT